MAEKILFDKFGKVLHEGDIVVWHDPEGDARIGCAWNFRNCDSDAVPADPDGLAVWYWQRAEYRQGRKKGVRCTIDFAHLNDTSGVTRIQASIFPERADEIRGLVDHYSAVEQARHEIGRRSEEAVRM